MYIITEHNTLTGTQVRGVFSNRIGYDRNISKILDTSALGSIVKVQTGKANSVLTNCRCIESFAIKIVPEVRQAVRLKR
jgi:hypothetical protein